MTPLKILITEDETLAALDLRRRLSNMGYDVPPVATSGEEAVERSGALEPDLVLMDIMLHGSVDGIEAAQRIRRQSDIPVIYLTANADNETVARLRDTEAAGFILKPYRERELQVSIEMAIKNHQLKQQLREANSDLENRVRRRTAELEKANESLTAAEQAASSWKKRYDMIVASSGLAVYDVDLASGGTVWSDGSDRVLGRAASMFNRADGSWLSAVHPDDCARVAARLEKAAAAGAAFDMTYRFGGGAEAHAWLHDRGFCLHDARGKCVRMLGLIQDVTEKRTVEEKMREQAALLDETHDAIMLRDLENRVLFWNGSAERLYGWSAEEAIGKSVKELLLQGQEMHVPEASAVTLKTGYWEAEVALFTKTGKRLTVQSRWRLLSDRSGRPYGFLVANTDLTERKILEQKFLRAQRLESIGILASGIAHDLNNVFTPILMASELLADDTTDPDRGHMLGLLRGSARRGSEMVKQILTFARGLEGGAGPIQLQHLLSELQSMMRETFPRQIRLETDVPTQLWPVNGDATQLYQVFMNLCINARDAMPRGGTLRIAAANLDIDESDPRFSLAQKSGRFVCVTVSDTGTGMSPEVQKKLFDPFFTTKDKGKGTGLGLSTVKTIVDTHAGFLGVETVEGEGTTFSIYFPADSAGASVKEGPAAAPPPGSGEWLLVAEDEASIREVLKATLEANGYEVLLAGDGAEAVRLYAAHKDEVAMVMTDMTMPFMDGEPTIRTLRKLNPKIKLLAATGALDKERVEALAREESFVVLQKPYTPHKLLAAIHKTLAG